MRQRAQTSPAKAATPVGRTHHGPIMPSPSQRISPTMPNSNTPPSSDEAIHSNSRHYQTQLSSRFRRGASGSSGSWEIGDHGSYAHHANSNTNSDHIALTVEEEDHEVMYMDDVESQHYDPLLAYPPSAPLSTPSYAAMTSSYPPLHSNYSSPPPSHYQQYQHMGGAAVMTEEKLRRFTEQHRGGTQYTRHATSSPSSSIGWTAWKLDYRLEDYHTVFRVPHHVPDAHYHAYVLGQMGQRKKDPSLLTKACCAQTCAVFSGIAVCFLLFIGILLDTQPLFIPGTLTSIKVQSTVTYASKQRTSTMSNAAAATPMKTTNPQSYTRPRIEFQIPGPNDARLGIATTAYQTAVLYFVTMLVSLYTMDPTPFHRAVHCVTRHWHRYEDIPDVHNGRNANGDFVVPTTNNGSSLSHSDFGLPHHTRGSYQPGLWHQTMNRIQRWLAVKGWYRARKFGGEKKKG